MTDVNDLGVISAMMERHEKQRLPRLLDIKNKVDSGEKVNDLDVTFLQEAYSEIQKIEPIIERHPEYQTLFSEFCDLCKYISSKALDNEKIN